jgi:hypothetical protein
MSSGVSLQFTQQQLPHNLHFHYNTENCCRWMKLCNFHVAHFQHVIFIIDFTRHLQVWVFKTPRGNKFWMVLVLTLRQLSEINCSACKRSVSCNYFLSCCWCQYIFF